MTTDLGTDWNTRAACVGVGDHIFFPPAGGSATHARKVCRGCPVRLDCLRFALEVEGDGVSIRGRFGIYGGLTPDERARLARRGAA